MTVLNPNGAWKNWYLENRVVGSLGRTYFVFG